MKQIALSQNQYALVDDADYGWLVQHKWYARRDRHSFYAVRNIKLNGKWRVLRMHRPILNLTFGDSRETDHIDGNGLNNQRGNLRVCSTAENQHNQRVRIGVSSEYKGVSWDKREGRWRAQIKIDGKQKSLGHFSSKVGAAQAYNRAAKELFGEYARLNEVQKKGALVPMG